MDDLNKECMLHFIELQTKPDFVKTTFKGAKSIQAAKSVYERSSDPTIHLRTFSSISSEGLKI